MQLAKPHMDVGLWTNNPEEMKAFYAEELGILFDSILPIGKGQRQHRHDMMGSVLKINHDRNGSPLMPPAGYRRLILARESLAEPFALSDPDGNRLLIVPDGWHGVTRIAMELGVRNVAEHEAFYGEALGLPRNADGGYLAGDSVIFCRHDADAPTDAAMEGTGFRYLTFQVAKVDEAHAAVLAAGGTEGRPPVTLGDIARISFVRDPDGNWIELSQRKSITGSLD